ncbi:hypothetical protein RJT34_20589 [Clitoria ternatea]|uniref:Secreted protein n=1 Tax=Clitoria ternatea TaxID=43366 RepID=A0AAN9ITR3_CLITE
MMSIGCVLMIGLELLVASDIKYFRLKSLLVFCFMLVDYDACMLENGVGKMEKLRVDLLRRSRQSKLRHALYWFLLPPCASKTWCWLAGSVRIPDSGLLR